jgi:hypothetical protein
MCWVKLPRHPGRAHAWPFCGPWPRPHLRNSLNCGLRSTWSRCHTNRSTAPVRRSPTQVARRSLRNAPGTGLSWGRRVAAAAARAKGQETPPLGCLGVAFFGGWPLRPALAPLARLARHGAKKLPRGDHRPHVSASWGDHFLMLTTKNLIRCQIPPQQGAAVGVVLSFGADLIPILNLDATLAALKRLQHRKRIVNYTAAVEGHF